VKKGYASPPKAGTDDPSADAQGYVTLVAELKQRIADARLRAASWKARTACGQP
jgi:hypothetical protein